MTLAQRMIVMNAGRAEQIGSPMEVYENPQTLFVAGFIGSPAMNFLAGKANGDGRIALDHGGEARTYARNARKRPRRHGRHPPRALAFPAAIATRIVSGPVEMVEQLGADTLDPHRPRRPYDHRARAARHIADGRVDVLRDRRSGARVRCSTPRAARACKLTAMCGLPAWPYPQLARASRRRQARAREHAGRVARGLRARLSDGGVRRQALGRRRRIPAARRDARSHDERPRPRRRADRGASCRCSTPAAGIRRSTPASRSPTLAGVARWSRAHDVAVNIEIKPTPRPRARDGRRGRARRRNAVVGRRCPPLLSSFSEAALDAAREAAPELPRAYLGEQLPDDWRERVMRLGCIALDLEAHAALAGAHRGDPRAGPAYRHLDRQRSGARGRSARVGRRHADHRRGRSDRKIQIRDVIPAESGSRNPGPEIRVPKSGSEMYFRRNAGQRRISMYPGKRCIPGIRPIG